MKSLRHGWGCQPPQTASCIHSRHIQSGWAHSNAVHWHTVADLHSFTHPSRLRFWGSVTCGVKIKSLCHGWRWQPPQTASCIHSRHIQSGWAHWFEVHMHTVAASHSYTHTTWHKYWGLGFGVTSCGVKMMSLRHGWGWQPPQTASCIHSRHILVEHIYMLSIGT